MPRIDISLSIPPLPEGFAGSPDELLEFIVQNGTFYIDGDAPAVQIGGARPTEDVGIWFGEFSVERYLNGKYRPISDVPVGLCSPWASVSASIPENYLLCDGRSLLRADYPELFTVIGESYGSESATTFNLPDFRGRSAVGAGTGDYAKQGITGKMKALVAATYAGFESILQTPLFTGSPTASLRKATVNVASGNFTSTRNPCVVMNWIIRSR